MKLAFKRAFGPNTNYLDWIIGIATFGAHSHVELVFPNGDCFSSAFGGGVKFRIIDFRSELLSWDFIEIGDINVKEEIALRDLAKLYVGKKYDLFGAILSITTPDKDINSESFYCSELCTALLNTIKETYTIHPSNSTPAGMYKTFYKRDLIKLGEISSMLKDNVIRLTNTEDIIKIHVDLCKGCEVKEESKELYSCLEDYRWISETRFRDLCPSQKLMVYNAFKRGDIEVSTKKLLTKELP